MGGCGNDGCGNGGCGDDVGVRMTWVGMVAGGAGMGERNGRRGARVALVGGGWLGLGFWLWGRGVWMCGIVGVWVIQWRVCPGLLGASWACSADEAWLSIG